jgi:hypothetical protein
VFEHEVVDASGSVYNPLTNAQAKHKFLQLCSARIGINESNALMNLILTIEQADCAPSI